MTARGLIIIGLTGSIGMGKTTAANALRRLGIPVHDSDAAVHRLLGPGGAAVAAVAARFPEAQSGRAIDRKKLGERVFRDRQALAALEAILHPLVRKSAARFLKQARARRLAIVALDIPLLFETRSERRVDCSLVVSAPPFVQRARVLGRAGMTAAKFAAILARQTPDAQKRRRADFALATGLDRRASLNSLRRILRRIKLSGKSAIANARRRPRYRNHRA
jgi:dephospho-CoA kinase